ncbi:hypothetical protein WME79_18960 [Sorangium sp. So ce726]|uniref:COMM domain-containing protein n=1 Tax=Sorangium sp. So ce726 TaxID=3133319 RepID=UPI003F61A28C
MTATKTPLGLRALGGAEPPPALADDLRRVLRMPLEAQSRLWQALGPCLADKLTEDTEKLLDVFTAAYRISGDDLARVIKASRFLIQSAAKLDVSADELGADLEVICPDAPRIREILLAGYAPAKAQIRQALATAALVEHGNLLVHAAWRLDTIEGAAQGAELRVSVAMLTLHYKEGTEMRRVTLQVLPDMMGKLREICEQALPPA